MLKFGLLFSALIYLATGTGEFIVLQSPKSCEFSGNEAIDGSDLSKVLSTCLGFTIGKGADWQGLTVKDPFAFADVVAVVAVDGVSSLGDLGKLTSYPINPVKNEYPIWQSLQENVLEHYPTIYKDKTISRVDLGSVETDITPDLQKFNNRDDLTDEDMFFLQDLAVLRSYIDSFKKDGIQTDQLPQINWYVLSSLHTVVDVRGSEDPITITFTKELLSAVEDLGKILNKLSNGKALVVAIVGDGSHTRLARAADDPSGNKTEAEAPDNRATVYTTNFPAIFNIMLWFGVVFVLSLIAISYFIGTMDPGRDSIIYRMTSNRMKKDS